MFLSMKSIHNINYKPLLSENKSSVSTYVPLLQVSKMLRINYAVSATMSSNDLSFLRQK